MAPDLDSCFAKSASPANTWASLLFTRFCISWSRAAESLLVLQMLRNPKYLRNGLVIFSPTATVRSRIVCSVSIPCLSLLSIPQSSPNATCTITSEVRSMDLANISVATPFSTSPSHLAMNLLHFSIIVDTQLRRNSGENPGLYNFLWSFHIFPSVATMELMPMSGCNTLYVGDLL